jgi:putative DNA primase/helicase
MNDKPPDANAIIRDFGPDALRLRSDAAPTITNQAEILMEENNATAANADTIGVAGTHGGRLSVTVADLMKMEIKRPEFLLCPWLAEGTLAMVSAWRGVGKTHFGIGAAVAVATGSEFLRWRAPKPMPVLFVDGEMGSYGMQDRFRAALTHCNTMPNDDYLRIITPDLLGNDVDMPNLATPEGQARLDADLEGRSLVVFDNLVTLFRRTEDPNSELSFQMVQEYLLRLRRRSPAVLLIDHDGKTFTNRGTSAKQDVLDTVIQLKHPKDYRFSEGARFEISFTKARSLWGKAVAPFEAHLTTGPNGGQLWTTRNVDQAELDRFEELKDAGYTDAAIRDLMEIGGSKVGKLKKQLASRVKD